MKLLMIGPYPPPHGGISVHVAETRKQMEQLGVSCRVVNLARGASPSSDYFSFQHTPELAQLLFRHARQGWTFHLHINGHNWKSWAVALLSGLAGRSSPGSYLTLHSGMAPAYLGATYRVRRQLARASCLLFNRIICVNEEIRHAIMDLGIPVERLAVVPAYLPAALPGSIPPSLAHLTQGRQPVLTSILFFRPEYGFDLLARAIARLRLQYPRLRCLVIGSGEEQAAAHELVASLGLQDSIELLGDQPHETCLALLSLSNLFVRPTLEDGDAVSVREALSLNIPVVASNVGTRPSGVSTFQAGSVDHLVSTIGAVLGGKQPASERPEQHAFISGPHRIAEIYGFPTKGSSSWC